MEMEYTYNKRRLFLQRSNTYARIIYVDYGAHVHQMNSADLSICIRNCRNFVPLTIVLYCNNQVSRYGVSIHHLDQQ